MADAQASMGTGTTALLVNGYKFRHNKTGKTTVMWTCLDKKCPSTCSTNIKMTSLLRTPGVHNHPATDKSPGRAHYLGLDVFNSGQHGSSSIFQTDIVMLMGSLSNVRDISINYPRSKDWSDYRNPESETGKWLKTFFALPSLLADEIEDAFTNSLMPDNPQDPYALHAVCRLCLEALHRRVFRISTPNVGCH
ncbi:hypothetical protein PoB_005239300 [Plakobranchus ocellatus]|uniref:FLYWCH-type domain-containing protein n=1 Tax=Plakobranchus ocellatus TaxID=259542 RepID=A0AAV4C4G5_9GAST|nr:hypothetical protein PoB_005239300 [Plakobranchus ocellatus]